MIPLFPLTGAPGQCIFLNNNQFLLLLLLNTAAAGGVFGKCSYSCKFLIWAQKEQYNNSLH